jgi:membrane protein
VTYYAAFSLCSLLLLVTSFAGLVLRGSVVAQEQIIGAAATLLPQGQAQLREVVESVAEARGGALSIGTISLVWVSFGWFQALEAGINRVWGVEQRRSWLTGRLLALVLAVAIGELALTSFVATAALHHLAHLTAGVPGTAVFWPAVISLVSGLTAAGAFCILYRYAPYRRVHFRDVWPAALATAVVWEGSRRAVAFYFETVDMVGFYGPIGGAMALLFWIYVASAITLIGAELSRATAAEREASQHPADPADLADPADSTRRSRVLP